MATKNPDTGTNVNESLSSKGSGVRAPSWDSQPGFAAMKGMSLIEESRVDSATEKRETVRAFFTGMRNYTNPLKQTDFSTAQVHVTGKDGSVRGELITSGSEPESFQKLLGQTVDFVKNVVGIKDVKAEKDKSTRGRSLKMGWCEVLNPPFQFNKNDDVRSIQGYPQIGRVYGEYIKSNYPILIIEVGRQHFRKDLSKLVGGNSEQYGKMAGYLSGEQNDTVTDVLSSLGSVISNTVGSLLGGQPDDKFASFINHFPMFKNFADTMLIEMASYLGLMKGNISVPGAKSGIDNLFSVAMGGAANFQNGYIGSMGGNLSMDNILGANTKFPNGDISQKIVKPADCNYLPFMIQNDVTVSESFSNSIGEHPLASQINSKAAESQRRAEGGGLAQMLDFSKPKDVVSTLLEMGTNKVTSDLNAGAGGEMGYIMGGKGRFQLPGVWEDSTYSRTYNISFNFFSPTGDTVSIFENVMVPTLIWLALSMPIKSGSNSYGEPFVLKCHCPGLFTVDYGMVESITVTRGEDKNDFTYGHSLPRSMKVSIVIRDLMPNLLMSFDGGIFSMLHGANSSFHNYLMNMAGLGLASKMYLGTGIVNLALNGPAKFANNINSFLNLNWASDTFLARGIATVFGGVISDKALQTSSDWQQSNE